MINEQSGKIANQNDKSLILNECLESLALVLEYDMQDFPTHQHAIRVGEGCVLIAEKMKFPPDTIQKMYFTGLLHDIGKISIDTKLLSKKGRITDQEFEIIKKHTIYGSRILASMPGLDEIALWVRWHHEWWDGSGYPDGLRKEEIPIEVQIISAVDCLDSLQTPRLDRDRLTPEQAYSIIEKDRGTFFNPEILEFVLEMVREKTLVPGKSSEKFIELKKKYIDKPMNFHANGYWEGFGMAGLHPVLHLFARVIDAKHHYTRGHSTRVSILSKFIAEKMGLSVDEIIKVEAAGLLHDAGKVSIPLEILNKPDNPDENEWKYIKEHPMHSYYILSHISSLSDIAEISACHHERLNGKGYPRNLRGDRIHKLAQIIAIADTYDAITSARTYRKEHTPEYAYGIIKKGLGTEYNTEAGQALLDTSPRMINALFDMYSNN